MGFQGSKLLYSSPTTVQQQQQLLHHRSQPFNAPPSKRHSGTHQQGASGSPLRSVGLSPHSTPRAQKTIYNEVQSSLLSSQGMRMSGKKWKLEASPAQSSTSSSSTSSSEASDDEGARVNQVGSNKKKKKKKKKST